MIDPNQRVLPHLWSIWFCDGQGMCVYVWAGRCRLSLRRWLSGQFFNPKGTRSRDMFRCGRDIVMEDMAPLFRGTELLAILLGGWSSWCPWVLTWNSLPFHLLVEEIIAFPPLSQWTPLKPNPRLERDPLFAFESGRM